MRALRVTATVVAALAVVQPAGSARAEDSFAPFGHVTLDISPASSSGFTYCVRGTVSTGGRVYGEWTVRLSGVRGGATYEPAPATSASATYDNNCPMFSKGGQTDGAVSIDVSYVAVGGNVLAHSTGAAYWHPTTGDQVFSVDLTP